MTPMTPPSPVLPSVRSIRFTQPLSWLSRGARDLWRARSASLAQGVALAAFSLLVLVLLFRPTGILGRPEVEKV